MRAGFPLTPDVVARYFTGRRPADMFTEVEIAARRKLPPNFAEIVASVILRRFRKELRATRHACSGLALKVILETGELRDDATIERAAHLALAEGADFLKTSTGKTPIGATPQAAAAMLRAIAADAAATHRVGFKASGGIRTVAAAMPYIDAVERQLGAQALTPARFRIGASSLLDDIEAVLAGAAAAPTSNDRY